MRPVACMITDRRRMGAPAEERLVRRVAAAAAAGVHLVQVREKDMTDRALVALVARIAGVVRGTRTRVLVNDRLDVALAAGAHGVHLRGDSVAASRVRAVTPHGFLVGRSVHSASEAAHVAHGGGVDYLLFGPVFDTASKPGHLAAGVQGLRQAVASAPSVPVLALGGVTTETVALLGATGCAGFAAIGLFTDVSDGLFAHTVVDALAPWDNRA